MITLTEVTGKKLPGYSSIEISSKFNQELVNAIHRVCDIAIFDKKTKNWYVPSVNLAKLLDAINTLDDIKLCLLPNEAKKSKDKVYALGPYKTTPRSYQEEAIQYGLNNDCWLLLDSPGLGKSASTIWLAQELIKLGRVKKVLVVCGVSALKHNWKKEIGIHSNLTCKILGERVTKKGTHVIDGIKERLNQLKSPIEEEVVITNIETLRDSLIVKELNNGCNKFDMIICDEIHHAKNPSAAQSKGLLKLKSKYKIGLTGTLLTNKPLDAYLPLKWIGAEDSSYTNFKYFYCVFGGNFGNDLIAYRNLDLLKEQISNNSLRRTKDLLTDLPKKNVIYETVEMDSALNEFYNNIVKGVVEQVDKVELNVQSILGMVTRLRQATSCPQVLTSENIKSTKATRIIEFAKDLLDDGEKVVIFSVFKDTLRPIFEELKSYGACICTGDTKDTIVSENIDRFQTDDSCRVLLATCQRLGTGVTLTAASYALFVDSPWTAADCEQAEDRIHRLGSKKPCFCYYFITEGTFDEKVKEIVQTKGMISDFVVDDKVLPQFAEQLKSMLYDLKDEYALF